jgi:tRNA threonylcarbamoyladenosine biosynthesis protein TsaE
MPILDPHTVEFFSHSAEMTRRVGMRLGALLRAGDLLCFQGDLGAGKTTFIQGVAQGWGSLDAVSSPTFVLVNLYRRADGAQLYHLDAYRIDSAAEAEELDFDAMLSAGALLIEWADRVHSILPAEYLWIKMDYLDEYRRSLSFRPKGKRYEALALEMRQAAFGK